MTIALHRDDRPRSTGTRTDDEGSQHLLMHVASMQPTEFVDLTDRLLAFVARAGVRTGLLAVHTLHTTTAVVVNENEPLLHEDVARQLEQLAPLSAPYDHDDNQRRTVNRADPERVNGHAHCRAFALGSSICLSIVDGRLLLGRWQRVLFVELDGPQERQVAATLLGRVR